MFPASLDELLDVLINVLSRCPIFLGGFLDALGNSIVNALVGMNNLWWLVLGWPVFCPVWMRSHTSKLTRRLRIKKPRNGTELFPRSL